MQIPSNVKDFMQAFIEASRSFPAESTEDDDEELEELQEPSWGASLMRRAV